MILHHNLTAPQRGDIWRYTSSFGYSVHFLACGEAVADIAGWNFQAIALDGRKAGSVEYWLMDYESNGRWEKLA